MKDLILLWMFLVGLGDSFCVIILWLHTFLLRKAIKKAKG